MIEARYTVLDTPVGQLALALTAKGLAAVSFGELDRGLPQRDLAIQGPSRGDGAAERVRRELSEYFEGRRRLFEVSLDWALSRGFRRRVLQELVKVPYGQTVTYGELAARAGNPAAARAVGSAMATNPLPIVVPCHRVLAAGGRLGGYSAGLGVKRWLLEHEGVLASTSGRRTQDDRSVVPAEAEAVR